MKGLRDQYRLFGMMYYHLITEENISFKIPNFLLRIDERLFRRLNVSLL